MKPLTQDQMRHLVSEARAGALTFPAGSQLAQYAPQVQQVLEALADAAHWPALAWLRLTDEARLHDLNLSPMQAATACYRLGVEIGSDDRIWEIAQRVAERPAPVTPIKPRGPYWGLLPATPLMWRRWALNVFNSMMGWVLGSLVGSGYGIQGFKHTLIAFTTSATMGIMVQALWPPERPRV
jgi:hypothetical protein